MQCNKIYIEKRRKQKVPEPGMGTMRRNKSSSPREKREHAAVSPAEKQGKSASKTLVYLRSVLRACDKQEFRVRL